MRRLRLIMTIALLLAGSAFAVDEGENRPAELSPPTANLARTSVRGQVVTADGVPIPGATLQAGQANTTADQEGNFCLSVIPGDYKVQVSAEGYAPVTLQLSIATDTE